MDNRQICISHVLNLLTDTAAEFLSTVEQSLQLQLDVLRSSDEKFAEAVEHSLEIHHTTAPVFEVYTYFLYLLDVSIFASPQEAHVRERVMANGYRSLARLFTRSLRSTAKELTSTMQQRLAAYGEVAAAKEGTEQLKGLHGLLSLFLGVAMKSGPVGLIPPMQMGLGIFGDLFLKTAMLTPESHLALPFRVALGDVFKNNTDFTELPETEVKRRLSAGFSRALDGVRSSEKSRDSFRHGPSGRGSSEAQR